MEAPSSLKLSLAILILRTANFTQDKVAGYLECGKPTIVKTEAWFKELRFAEAEALYCDPSSKEEALSLIAGSKEGLLPSELIKVGSISGDNILRHYRRDDYLKQKTKSIPTVYRETPHKQKMRELAANLRDQVSLPPILNSFFVDQKPPRSLKGLVFKMGENRLVKIEFESAGHLSKALHSHLHTGGFKNITNNIKAWRKRAEDNLTRCYKFFTLVKEALECTYKTSIPVEERGQAGFSVYYPILLCADAIERAGGSNGFQDYKYIYEPTKLTFCGHVIYYGTTGEDLKIYELAHVKLIKEYAKHRQARAIAKKKEDLLKIQKKIKQQLQKFIDMERVPGRCELC